MYKYFDFYHYFRKYVVNKWLPILNLTTKSTIIRI